MVLGVFQVMSKNSVADAVTYVFEWESQPNSCLKCASLNRKQWMNQTIDQPTLNDDVLGPIWDLNADRSLMHGGSGTCRCHLWVRVEIDFSKLESYSELQQLTTRLT